ncbi:LOW QUALITY PROTEIN: hypothetical protein PanWU01x14_365420, partial [Parasponia andersonii]
IPFFFKIVKSNIFIIKSDNFQNNFRFRDFSNFFEITIKNKISSYKIRSDPQIDQHGS